MSLGLVLAAVVLLGALLGACGGSGEAGAASLRYDGSLAFRRGTP